MRCKSFKKGCAVGLIALFIIGSLTFPVVAENTGIFNTQGTIYVDDDANCPGHGTLDAPYCTIQLAIDNADDGNDIKIASGEYYENIIVDKKLTLDWHGSDINGSDTGIPVINGGGNGIVVSIKAFDVIIKKCSITNSGETDLDAGIYLDEGSKDVTILENEISDCYYGIWIKRYTALETNHEIRKNKIDNIDRQGIVISLSNGNSIYNNNITNCGLHGIHLLDCNENRIKENKLQNNKFGLIIDVGMENEVELNTCQNNNQWGFVVINTQKTVITTNNFMDNGLGQATWINCRGDKWFQNYWGKRLFFLHVVFGTLRGADLSFPWFKIELSPSSSPNSL